MVLDRICFRRLMDRTLASEAGNPGSIPGGSTKNSNLSSVERVMIFKSHLSLESSATLAINTLALTKKARGERVYNLSAGEPALAPHPAIVASVNEALAHGKTLYPPVAGIPELRQEITAWFNKMYHASYAAENSLITCGGKFAVYAACQAFLTAGDEVLVIAPYWVSYPSLISLFGATPRIVATSAEKEWHVQVEDLEKAVTPRTKMLIINNAANPTGALYTATELKNILQFAAAHNLLVVSDEVYSGLTYEGEFVSAASFDEFNDRVLVVQSFSKHFAMTGWRVGVALGPQEVIAALTALQSHSTTGTSSISQWAAVGALRAAEAVNGHVKEAMNRRRQLLQSLLYSELGINVKIPSGLYAFVSLAQLGVTESNSVKWCEALIEQGNVAAVPGSAFGAEGYVRVSFGAEEGELVEGVQALKRFLKKNTD